MEIRLGGQILYQAFQFDHDFRIGEPVVRVCRIARSLEDVIERNATDSAHTLRELFPNIDTHSANHGVSVRGSCFETANAYDGPATVYNGDELLVACIDLGEFRDPVLAVTPV